MTENEKEIEVIKAFRLFNSDQAEKDPALIVGGAAKYEEIIFHTPDKIKKEAPRILDKFRILKVVSIKDFSPGWIVFKMDKLNEYAQKLGEPKKPSSEKTKNTFSFKQVEYGWVLYEAISGVKIVFTGKLSSAILDIMINKVSDWITAKNLLSKIQALPWIHNNNWKTKEVRDEIKRINNRFLENVTFLKETLIIEKTDNENRRRTKMYKMRD